MDASDLEVFSYQFAFRRTITDKPYRSGELASPSVQIASLNASWYQLKVGVYLAELWLAVAV